MGVIYYIACKTCKKCSELGKGRWKDNPFDGKLMDFLQLHNGDCELHYFSDAQSCYIEEDVLFGGYTEEVE